MHRVGQRFFIFVLILFQSIAFAEEDQSEYDFGWLDPDKTIYVVQNRKFLKGKRIEPSVGAGIVMGNAFQDSKVIMGRLVYYFSERWGVGGVFGVQSNADNDTFVSLKTVTSTIPNVRTVTAFYGLGVHWIPFYGKLNLFNKIFYLDWHIELGMAPVSSEVDLNASSSGNANFADDSHTGFYWGSGWKFFITERFAARLDLLALYYSAAIVKNGVIQTDSEAIDRYYLTLGISTTF